MDDITDERLREISQGATIYGHERNAIAAELLAARARIAKLEQEPPMALVDFGVGVNWKGLHKDMQRLRAERDAARAQLHADDQRAWEALNKPEGTHDTTNVQRLCAEVERLLRLMPPTARGITNGPGEGSWSVFAEKVVAERDAARADLREAMELLRWASPDMDNASWDEWGGRANLLLVKHKEAADG